MNDSNYMTHNKIIVCGIGPGSPGDMTYAVREALMGCDVVVGYKPYFPYVMPFLRSDTQCIDTGMKREIDRAQEAVRLAMEGRTVCVISSGDAGIYGMAPLLWEMKCEQAIDLEIEVLPGISAFQKTAGNCLDIAVKL